MQTTIFSLAYIVPESTKIFCPVMDSADSDRRNATVPATDFKLVGDFSDVRLKILDFCSGVSDALIDVSINLSLIHI